MKCETPIYKGFARGLPSRDTHPGSHPDTHHLGESEVNSNEVRPHSSVVQVTVRFSRAGDQIGECLGEYLGECLLMRIPLFIGLSACLGEYGEGC